MSSLTVRSPIASTCVFSYGRDESAAVYLASTLEAIDEANGSSEPVLCPVVANANMLDAVSRALIGRQILSSVLRVAMTNELRANMQKYKTLLRGSMSEGDWERILEESDGPASVHMFALANALDRPILLLDKTGSEQSSLFLPLIARRSHANAHTRSEGCCSDPKTLPILLAWANAEHDHLVPLVGIQRSTAKYSDIRMPSSMLPSVFGAVNREEGQRLVQEMMVFEQGGQCVLMRRHFWFSVSTRPSVIIDRACRLYRRLNCAQ